MQAEAEIANTVSNNSATHVDVLIVGAGLSGIGAGYHLQKNCPGKSYAILEGRDAIGGTWDLFRYPGIRSDSDMYTLGYSFKPWTEPKAIADGPRILNYVRETARENGIESKIRFNHQVKSASWSSKDRAGPWKRSGGRTRSACSSPAASCSCAAAITPMKAAMRRSFPAAISSRAALPIRRSGRAISNTPASAWW
jgi:cation diffusion facilitator CzcD-associated flavoprotein CzcO